MKRLILIAGFAVALLSAAADGFASTLNITFSGTITNLNDPSGTSGYTNGGKIDGTLHMDLLSNGPNVTDNQPDQFYVEYDGTGSFQVGSVSHTSQVDIAETWDNTGGQKVSTLELAASSQLILGFRTLGNKPNPILSLANLPANKAAIFAYLGGVSTNLTSFFEWQPTLPTGYQVDFLVDSIKVDGIPVVTPIPAALPLFLSAIGGLGFFAWRRKRASAHAA